MADKSWTGTKSLKRWKKMNFFVRNFVLNLSICSENKKIRTNTFSEFQRGKVSAGMFTDNGGTPVTTNKPIWISPSWWSLTKSVTRLSFITAFKQTLFASNDASIKISEATVRNGQTSGMKSLTIKMNLRMNYFVGKNCFQMTKSQNLELEFILLQQILDHNTLAKRKTETIKKMWSKSAALKVREWRMNSV